MIFIISGVIFKLGGLYCWNDKLNLANNNFLQIVHCMTMPLDE